MPQSRYRISEPQRPHFLSCSDVRWLPLFRRAPLAQIPLDSLRFLQQHDRLEVYAYVIMWDHIHLIASSTELSKQISAFKSFTARKIIDWFEKTGAQPILDQLARAKPSHKHDSTHQLWQTGSHPQLIQGEEMMRQKIQYIHHNPVRKGYVDEPTQWQYSSARTYAGKPGPLEVTCAW